MIMKKKSFNKELVLNKETVANLNGNEMESVKGGKVWDTKDDSMCHSYYCSFEINFPCPIQRLKM